MLWAIAVLMLAVVTPSSPEREGKLKVFLHCAIDLDAGRCDCIVVLDGDGTEPPSHPSGKNYDFRLEPRGRHIYLEPRNGASLASPTQSQSGLSGCMAATYFNARRQVDGLSDGTYMCARTSEGRYAELRVEETIVAGAERASLGYTTWAN